MRPASVSVGCPDMSNGAVKRVSAASCAGTWPSVAMRRDRRRGDRLRRHEHGVDGIERGGDAAGEVAPAQEDSLIVRARQRATRVDEAGQPRPVAVALRGKGLGVRDRGLDGAVEAPVGERAGDIGEPNASRSRRRASAPSRAPSRPRDAYRRRHRRARNARRSRCERRAGCHRRPRGSRGRRCAARSDRADRCRRSRRA